MEASEVATSSIHIGIYADKVVSSVKTERGTAIAEWAHSSITQRTGMLEVNGRFVEYNNRRVFEIVLWDGMNNPRDLNTKM